MANYMYEDEWGKNLKEPNYARMLHNKTETLFATMLESLEDAIKKGREIEEKMVNSITKFFTGKDEKNRVDSCIRWLVLYFTARYEPADSTPESMKAHSLLVKIIVEIDNALAFDNLYSSNAELKLNIRSQCKSKGDHNAHQKQKGTPFLLAVQSGHADAVRIMIAGIHRHFQSLSPPSEEIKQKDAPFLKILHSSGDGTSILSRAANASSHRLETIEELLKYPDIVRGDDDTFLDSLTNGDSDIMNKFLDVESLHDKLITDENIIKAMDIISNDTSMSQARREKQEEIIRILLKHMGNRGPIRFPIVEKIIELGLAEFWELVSDKLELSTEFLLPIAVLHQRIEFVDLFLDKYPKSAVQANFWGAPEALIPGKLQNENDEQAQGHFPLWYNNKKWDGSNWVDRQGSTEIRKALVSAIIKQSEKMQWLSEIFHQSAEKVRELCFDMTQFNSKSYPIPNFFYSLIYHNENEQLLSYETTIKYARFPALDLHTDDRDTYGESIKNEHREVFDVLDWLRENKKVETIIELKVPDRLVNPHNEDDIADYVDKFGVEVLNWRFLDMSLSLLKNETKSRIKSLHLYSSGKRAPIDHWFSATGLPALKNLSEISIHIVQELMTNENCRKIRNYLNTQLQALQESWQGKLKLLTAEAISQPWNPIHERMANLEEIAQRAFPKLSPFIKSYRSFSQSNETDLRMPTKVAIIDNGILSIAPRFPSDRGLLYNRSRRQGDIKPDEDQSGGGTDHDHPSDKSTAYKTLWARIKDGKSFVDDDSQVSPWLFASDPHGTQMANLICAIDPLCELYVAKVTNGKKGILPNRVAKAIEWAQAQKVDVICMSFAMSESSIPLQNIISKANAAGIVMLCSTHDEGAKTSSAYPAHCDETMAITACDEYGELHRPLDEAKYRYKLQGLNVPAGVVPFLESNDRISGSSVATAITTGLSSLIIACIRLANPDARFSAGDLKSYVVKRLDDMMSTKNSKYVLLQRFANIDERMKKGEPISAQIVLDRKFKLPIE